MRSRIGAATLVLACGLWSRAAHGEDTVDTDAPPSEEASVGPVSVPPSPMFIRPATATTIAAIEPPRILPPPLTVAILPNGFYTPETGVAGGVLAILFFKTNRECDPCRTSNAGIGAIYTQHGQFLTGFLPELFFDHDNWQVLGNYRWVLFPGRYYGIGNSTSDDAREDFTTRYLRLRTDVRRRLFSSLFAGLRYDYDLTHPYDFAPGGELASGTVTGSSGGRSSGVGATLTWDNRDAVVYPTRGSYHQLSATYYAPGFGSEYSFARIQADFRHYIGFGKQRVLALEAIAQLGAGDAPFYLLAIMGGASQMRGVFEGRYRDNNLVVGQVEYRTPLVWRIGAAVFASAGQVASSMLDINPAAFHVAGGGGIRFVVDEKQYLNFRADVGFSDAGWSPYVIVREAF